MDFFDAYFHKLRERDEVTEQFSIRNVWMVRGTSGSVIYFDTQAEAKDFVEHQRKVKVNILIDEKLADAAAIDCICVPAPKDDYHSPACAFHNTKGGARTGRISVKDTGDLFKPYQHPDYDDCDCPDTLAHRDAVGAAQKGKPRAPRSVLHPTNPNLDSWE